MTGGFSGFIADHRGDRGDRPDPLQRARMAADRPDQESADPDEVAAGLLAKGYVPGMTSDLAQRYADTMAEAAGERDKIEASRRLRERLAREHAAGRITAVDIARLDAGEGDAGRLEQLERRAESLRRQITDTQAMIAAQPQRDPDPVMAASRAAHEAFVTATRAKLDAARQSRPQPGPRPFAYVSRGARPDAEHTGPDCWICAEARRLETGRGYNELAGPSITRTLGYDEGGVLGNYAAGSEISR